jgi:steroid 5-alpha reductase family enzyme
MTMLGATLIASLAAFTLFWAASLKLKDAGIVDFYWGPGFVVIGWLAWALAPGGGWPGLVVLAAVSLWGVRLGWHMIARHGGVEDPRYGAMRAAHGSSFATKSLWMVFWLQAAIQWAASSPALSVAATPAVAAAASLASPLPALLFALGLALFAGGFLLEAAADRAIRRFQADPANAGKLLTTGLHARVRHPNYLGEIILQWGIGAMALAASGNPLALVGPAMMHALILRLSGVPMLEAHLAARDGFAEWKARTNALWPRLRG